MPIFGYLNICFNWFSDKTVQCARQPIECSVLCGNLCKRNLAKDPMTINGQWHANEIHSNREGPNSGVCVPLMISNKVSYRWYKACSIISNWKLPHIQSQGVCVCMCECDMMTTSTCHLYYFFHFLFGRSSSLSLSLFLSLCITSSYARSNF